MALARACLAAVMALPCGWTPAQPALTVVADAHPPFLLPARDGLAGPYAEAFHYLAGKAGLEVALKTAPAKRALLLAAAEKNTCALDVNFDQGKAETLSYVAAIAPVVLQAYAAAGNAAPFRSLSDFRGRTLGTVDIAEARDLLSSAQLPYIPIAKPALGFKMLAAKRLEVFVSDTPPQPDTGPPPRKVLLLTPAERWLACNPDTPPPVLSKLRQALRAGLFAKDTAAIWRQHHMDAFFQETSATWARNRQ
ncbi:MULTISPECIES: hypothetical protein [Chromobacterium]|uniref:Solute-binding protein family 3/N-terminal domain-containing protein n=1 Tax=Chromobacterium aquaticum TaxID=467180 RepID=A0ABV8ZVP3_9NEIS|nr:hypothetical protein [Chromobacterium aquaticum]MCD5362069.1 hypothetical protein [Chromobacterium aquaticum]